MFLETVLAAQLEPCIEMDLAPDQEAPNKERERLEDGGNQWKCKYWSSMNPC